MRAVFNGRKTTKARRSEPLDLGSHCLPDYILDNINLKSDLVPEWIDTLDGKWTKPTRIICVLAQPFEKNESGAADYVLQRPMTRAILNGQIPPESKTEFVVVRDPSIEIRRGDGNTLH